MARSAPHNARISMLWTGLLASALLMASPQQDPVDGRCSIQQDTFPAPVWAAERNTRLLAEKLASIPALDRATRKDITATYKERSANFTEALKDGLFRTGSAEEAFVDSVFRRILRAQPEIDQDTRLYLTCQRTPNAYTTGDRNIFLNIGLLERLGSEAQLAFVLCHELAHQQLDHVDRAICDHHRRLNDPVFEKELRRILRSEYNRLARLEALVLDVSFTRTRHSRLHESSADSLGLVFLSRTGYPLQAAMEVMDVLDSADHEALKEPVDLRTHLDLPDKPFDPAWDTGMPATSLAGVDIHDKELEDSLKTHPECKARKRALDVQLTALGWSDRSPIAPDSGFQKVRHASALAVVESSFQESEVARAMYLAMKLAVRHPEDAYLRAAVVRGFAWLHVYQKAHRLSEVMDRPHPENSEDYNRFLVFLETLRLSELRDLGLAYLGAHGAGMDKCPELLYAGAIMAYSAGNEADLNARRERYRALYPAGRRAKRLGSLKIGTFPAP